MKAEDILKEAAEKYDKDRDLMEGFSSNINPCAVMMKDTTSNKIALEAINIALGERKKPYKRKGNPYDLNEMGGLIKTDKP